MALPTIIIVGNLTADPELKFTANGAAMCKMRVACSDRRKNPTTGEWEDGDTTYLNVTLWRQTAENTAETLSKGDRVIITGKLKSRTIENTDGSKTTYYEVDVDDVGPALSKSSATVKRVSRTSSTSQTDPWAASPASIDAPPF